MKAVIWTDVFQSVVMLGGLLTMIIMGIVHVGGVSVVFERACDGGRLNFLKYDLNFIMSMLRFLPLSVCLLVFFVCILCFAVYLFCGFC